MSYNIGIYCERITWKNTIYCGFLRNCRGTGLRAGNLISNTAKFVWCCFILYRKRQNLQYRLDITCTACYHIPVTKKKPSASHLAATLDRVEYSDLRGWILFRPRFHFCYISYYGGEPLLARQTYALTMISAGARYA